MSSTCVAFFSIICRLLSGLSPVDVVTGVNLSLYSHWCTWLLWDQCHEAWEIQLHGQPWHGGVPTLMQPCRVSTAFLGLLHAVWLHASFLEVAEMAQSLAAGRGDTSTHSLTIFPSPARMSAWCYLELSG